MAILYQEEQRLFTIHTINVLDEGGLVWVPAASLLRGLLEGPGMEYLPYLWTGGFRIPEARVMRTGPIP